MNKGYVAALASGIFIVLFSGSAFLVEPAVQVVLDRYPGAEIIRNQEIDTQHLAHGWLNWHATYETASALETVALWYADRLPDAETHAVGQCQTLRQAQSLWHFQRAVTVQLCTYRSGTAILVSEDFSLMP